MLQALKMKHYTHLLYWDGGKSLKTKKMWVFLVSQQTLLQNHTHTHTVLCTCVGCH